MRRAPQGILWSDLAVGLAAFLAFVLLPIGPPPLARVQDDAPPPAVEDTSPENPAVDTDGAIDLRGAVVVPSRWAVLILVVVAFVLSILVALVALRSEERNTVRREAEALRRRLADQDAEIERLRSGPDGAAGRPAEAEVP